MFGLGLYAGEGSRTDPNSAAVCSCAPELIRAAIRFFEAIGVARGHIRAQLSVHPGVKVRAAERHWRHESGLPSTQFTATTVALSQASRGLRGRMTPHGTLRVRVHDTRIARKIVRWLELSALSSTG